MSEQYSIDAGYLPWQQHQRNALQDQLANDRLPHAMLLQGPPGIGKKQFAFAFACQLLCQKPDQGIACGSCSACHLTRVGSHSDLRIIRSEASSLIKIEQIRALIDWMGKTAQQNGAKVTIIYSAEQMNVQSANALLKCLEEPTRNTYFLLVTDQPGRLLATVKSRCQRLEFPVPETSVAIEWLSTRAETEVDIDVLLRLANGAPLKVMSRIDDGYAVRRQAAAKIFTALLQGEQSPMALAGALVDKENPAEVYDLLYQLLVDALKTALTGGDNSIINNDMRDIINVIIEVYSTASLVKLIDKVIACRRAILSQSNPNPQLLIESMLIGFAEQRLIRA